MKLHFPQVCSLVFTTWDCGHLSAQSKGTRRCQQIAPEICPVPALRHGYVQSLRHCAGGLCFPNGVCGSIEQPVSRLDGPEQPPQRNVPFRWP